MFKYQSRSANIVDFMAIANLLESRRTRNLQKLSVDQVQHSVLTSILRAEHRLGGEGAVKSLFSVQRDVQISTNFLHNPTRAELTVKVLQLEQLGLIRVLGRAKDTVGDMTFMFTDRGRKLAALKKQQHVA